jgi:uncharacterized protein YggT (Ycf19 family)
MEHDDVSTTKETIVTSTPNGMAKRTQTTVSQETPPVDSRKKALFHAYQLLWYLLGVLEVILVARFLLRFLAANPASGFTALVYALSEPFVLPFRGIFPPVVTEGSVLEWSTIIAMIVYALIVYGIIHFLHLGKPARPEEIERTVENP